MQGNLGVCDATGVVHTPEAWSKSEERPCRNTVNLSGCRTEARRAGGEPLPDGHGIRIRDWRVESWRSPICSAHPSMQYQRFQRLDVYKAA